jgi:hypothetical protein
MRVLEGLPGVQKTTIFGTAVHAVFRGGPADLGALGFRLAESGVEGAELALVEPSLEDVFLDVVEGATADA